MKKEEKSSVIETKNKRAEEKSKNPFSVLYAKIMSGGTKGLEYAILSDTECAISGGHCLTTDIVIPRYMEDYKVTEIAYEAFADKIGLTSVKLHGGIKKIGTKAFCKCTGLKK